MFYTILGIPAEELIKYNLERSEQQISVNGRLCYDAKGNPLYDTDDKHVYMMDGKWYATLYEVDQVIGRRVTGGNRLRFYRSPQGADLGAMAVGLEINAIGGEYRGHTECEFEVVQGMLADLRAMLTSLGYRKDGTISIMSVSI